jgi:hypothetical protein
MSTPILALKLPKVNFPARFEISHCSQSRRAYRVADTSHNLTFNDATGILLNHPSCCILSMQKGEEVGVVHSEAEAGVLHQGEVVEGCQSHST